MGATTMAEVGSRTHGRSSYYYQMELETVPPADPSISLPLPDYPAPRISDHAQRHERRVVEAAAREMATVAELRGPLTFQPFARILVE